MSDYIKGYIERAKRAQHEFEKYTQEQVDQIVKIAGRVVYDNAEMLAELAVEETGMGVYEDKVKKNKQKSKIIYNDLKDKKSVGIIERDEKTGISKVAKPMGVVAAITPCTNPIVTPMSNIMFAVKGRNAIVITPHHRAIKCSTRTVDMINAELSKIGAPENLIQILDEQSRENTRELISSADIIIATGGMGMVKAAYSSGKPALGVGAGNVQCIVDDDADISEAVPKIIIGRTYDNGIICSGEQSIIATDKTFDKIIEELRKNNTLVIEDKQEREAYRNAIFEEGHMNRHAIGQGVNEIAKLAKKEIPENTKMIAIVADGYGSADILAKEKMCPVIALFKSKSFEDSVEIARQNLETEGKGHSAAIHSNNKEHIEYAANILAVSRFIVNQPSATSAGGSFFNGLAPTNTLGCGSWGNNSISENLTYKHLINVSRIAYYMEDNPVPTDDELWG